METDKKRKRKFKFALKNGKTAFILFQILKIPDAGRQ